MSLSYSQSKQISDRYAKAAYSCAQEKNAGENVLADLQALVAAMKESEELTRLMKSQTVAEAQKLAFFDALLAKADASTKDIVAMLVRQKRIGLLPMITESYQQQLDAAQGVTSAEIVTAKPLDAKALKAVEKVLKDETKQAVRLTAKVNPELIGGMVIRMAGRQIDGSVAGQLKRLHQRLSATS
jgi:F-type H+-transporting ATPase subunit delta